MYQRAAHLHRTRTSFSDRRSRDLAYLQWAAAEWTRRAYRARTRALVVLHRRLAVTLPRPPGLHASLFVRVSYSRRLTLRLRSIYPGRITRSLASARHRHGKSPELLRFWQVRSAGAAVAVSLHAVRQAQIPDWLNEALLCIHAHEAAWASNTGNGYYGGLQMDIAFQSRYGHSYLGRWGTADNWPAWAQLETAAHAYQSGRGFSPWPNTARACGLT
jgi:hypothetical protein